MSLTRDLDICSLAENTRAMLVGRDWEGLGFWRWEVVRIDERGSQSRRKVYYDCDTKGRARMIPPREWPTGWRPLRPLAAVPPPPRPPFVEEPEDHLPLPLAIVKARLLVALKIDTVFPNRERFLQRVRCHTLETRAGPGDWPKEQVTRWQPSAAQLADYLTAMGWISWAEPDEIRLLKAHANGWSWKSIAEEFKTDVTTIKRRHTRLIEDAHATAIGDRRQAQSGAEARAGRSRPRRRAGARG